MQTKQCCECGNQFHTLSPKFCSRKCFHLNYGKNHRAENSPRWKGKDVGYHGIHRWLTSKYGRGKNCEFCSKQTRLHWAKVDGKEYERIRANFIELCSSCHKKYDMTDVVRTNMSKSKIGKPSNRKGTIITPETREKIRLGLRRHFHQVDQ